MTWILVKLLINVNGEEPLVRKELYKIMLHLGLDSWRLVSMYPIGRANENDNLLLNGEEIKKILDFIKSKKKDKRLKLKYGCPGFLGLEYEKEPIFLL